MMNYQELKGIYKEHGHEKVLFVGIDIGKYKHVVSIWNGYKDVILKPFEFKYQEVGYQRSKDKLGHNNKSTV